MHILGIALAVFVALDALYTMVRLLRAARRQQTTGSSDAVIIEAGPEYALRMVRAALPGILILLTLVLAYLAVVHFGPLKPIHEW